MNKGRQLRLPKLGSIEKVKRERLFPQPHVGKVKYIKKFEILYRPFDLKFRGKVNKWLEFLKIRNFVNLEEILDEFPRKIIRLYFYPQKPEGRWLNQNEVLIKIKLNSKKKLRKTMVNFLIQIWERLKTQ